MPICELCEREVKRTSKHHLLPKSKGGKHTKTVALCQPCHSSIHHHIDNKTLAKQYTDLQTLKNAEELQVYLEWIKKRNVEKLNF